MNQNRVLAILALILALTLSGAAYAASVDDLGQPNDPRINERANACYEGAEWAGKCVIEIEWVAGWYYIRLKAGIIGLDDIPSHIAWILPSPSDAGPPVVVMGIPAGCHEIGGGLYILWPGGTGPSGEVPAYADSACYSTYVGLWSSRVAASNQTEASALCGTIADLETPIAGTGLSLWRC